LISTAGRPTVGRTSSRRRPWGVVLSLALVSGLLFLPAISANAAAGTADLSVSGRVSPDTASGGGTLTFKFNVHNEGPDPALDTTLVAELPPGLTLTSISPSSGSCGAASSTLTCALGTLDKGQSDISVGILVVTPDVDVETLFDVQGTVTASTSDPDDTNNALVVTGFVEPRLKDLADVELTSVHNVPNPVTGGYDLGSTATVTNLGPGDATGVTLSDALSPGEAYVTAGSDPSCSASAGTVTCVLSDMANGDVATVLIVTKTPQVDADTTIHDAFAVTATEDGTPDNDALDVATEVRAPRADFVAGYVPSSDSTTWLNDATRWNRDDPRATNADTTVAFVGIPGGGPGGPVVVTELPCGAPFACVTARRTDGRFFSDHAQGVFGSLVHVSVPSGYGASNPITAVFLDDRSILGHTWHPFKVTYQSDATGLSNVLSSCGGWRHRTGPPCVSSIGRPFERWNHYGFADLRTVVRFIDGGTFGRGR
jgi:uncharacterized repeat protein (TIGR01451 family)